MGGGEGCFSIGGALFLRGWAPLGGIGFDGEVSKKIIRQEGGTPMPSPPLPPFTMGNPVCFTFIYFPGHNKKQTQKGGLNSDV